MYIVEYRLEQSRRSESKPSIGQVTNDHCILGSFETFKEGRDYLRRYYEGHHCGVEKEEYKQEHFYCSEYARPTCTCEARTWKSWETTDGEDYIITSYEELHLHPIMEYPFDDIVDYQIG